MSATALVEPVDQLALRAGRRGGWLDIVRQAASLGRTRAGLVIVGLVVAVALLGPFFAPHSPTAFVAAPYATPSPAAELGTDFLGRDVLSRFLNGGRALLLLSFLSAVLGVGAGTVLGLVAGYSRRLLDEVVMRSLDVILSFPAIVFALLFMSLVGPKPWLLVVNVGASHAPRVARVVRAATLQVVEREFMKYAETLGVPRRRMLFGEILPNVTAPVTVEFGLRSTYSIGLVAVLAYLGFGLRPPAADWGLMINENQLGLTIQPWPVLLPVLAIALLAVGTNLVTDGFARASAGIDREVEAGEGA
jgi:peptide/nickel transport system permease protein